MDKQTQKYTWWIKVLTNKNCNMYYFGDFESYKEAEQIKNVYIQNLEKKQIKKVNILIELNEPKEISTIWEKNKEVENLIIVKNNLKNNTLLTKLLNLLILI